MKAVFARRIMRGADFERHLVLAPRSIVCTLRRARIPEMEMVAVFVGEQVFRNDPVLEFAAAAPFA
jgi:hypothetical protein